MSMPRYLIYPLYTAVFTAILVVLVPRKDIRRLAIYGIIFGGIFDVMMLIIGQITGLFAWINHGPLGYNGMQIFSPLSWAIYFILYYYFLPKIKPLNYVFMLAGIFFSILYTNLVIGLKVFESPYSRFWIPLASFIFWFLVATWGYYKLSSYVEAREQQQLTSEQRQQPSQELGQIPWKLRPELQPARKPEKQK